MNRLKKNSRILPQIVLYGTKVNSTGLVAESIQKYIQAVEGLDESEIRLRQMGLPFDREQGLALLREIYC